MHPIKSPVYQTQQIRECEHLAIERFGMTSQLMMQRAGKAAFDFMQRRWPHAQKITVCCGNGNNGGDGYELALLAHERGMRVVVWQVGDPARLKNAAKIAYESCLKAKVDMRQFTTKAEFEHPDVIVDAICGIGLHETLREEVVDVIKKMQNTHVPILAMDVPTGIDADSGHLLGAAVHATATITFIGLKIGLLTGSGIAYAGELILNDLQLPSDIFSLVEPIAEKVTTHTFASYLAPRMRDWHKGLSGHVLIVGGEFGFSGAPKMAALAALRVGAGLVSVATRVENALVMNTDCPEVMCHGFREPKELDALISRATVVVLGPGLGQTDWAKAVWHYLCEKELPMVMDADALTLLAQTNQTNENWVLTPHPGEAARLLETTSANVQQDRMDAIKAINKRYGGVCVLKGAGSMILSPNTLPALCDKGNPGMATAGMGDILSGVIGGLIAQGMPLGDAAKLGVCMHAAAGDLAAKDGERGMMATDLLPQLRRLSNQHV